MKLTVDILIHRKLHIPLRHRDRYKRCLHWSELPQLGRSLPPFDVDEKLMGAYENVPGSTEKLLVFTNFAVHLKHGEIWQSLKYKDIKEIDWPIEGESKASILVVHTDSGEEVLLPVLGESEFGRDYFIVMGFLNRISHAILGS